MNNKKSTKRALLTSLVSMVLCLTMLIGTTFAWFTDEVTSGSNKIQAGTLDIQLLMHDGSDYKDISENTAPIFGAGSIAQNNNAETLWEPGKTQVAYLAIKNNGTLDLKYKVDLNITGSTKDLYKAMQYAIIADAEGPDAVTAWDASKAVDVVSAGVVATDAQNIALEKGATHYFALAVHMEEEAGNEYQGGTVDFDIIVSAAQLASEEDSFDETYDALATYGDNTLPSPDITENGETVIKAPEWNSSYSQVKVDQVLDATYTFQTTETAEQAAAGKYGKWNADFVVKLVDGLNASTETGIAGEYGNWGWIGFTADLESDIPAGEEIRLLKAYTENNIRMTYEELCSLVGTFNCGIWNNDTANSGKNVVVELRLYETYYDDTNSLVEVVPENYEVVSSISYTLK